MARVNRRLAWALGVALFVVFALDIVALVSEPRGGGTALPTASPTSGFFPSPSPELSPTVDAPSSPSTQDSPIPLESPEPQATETPSPEPSPDSTEEPNGIADTGAGFFAAWPLLGFVPLLTGSVGILLTRRRRREA